MICRAIVERRYESLYRMPHHREIFAPPINVLQGSPIIANCMRGGIEESIGKLISDVVRDFIRNVIWNVIRYIIGNMGRNVNRNWKVVTHEPLSTVPHHGAVFPTHLNTVHGRAGKVDVILRSRKLFQQGRQKR